MPWLGDGTWVQDYRLARAIVHGRTKYRPWSGELPKETDKGNVPPPPSPEEPEGKNNEQRSTLRR